MKNYTKSQQNHGKYPVFTQNFNPRKKNEIQKIFLVSNSTLEELLTIPLTFLYDEYIDRPNLSEQKNHWSI